MCQISQRVRKDFSAYQVFKYLEFYVAFNTVQVRSRQVVGRIEETSTYSSSRFCTVNCRPTASNYQLSHLRPCWEPNPGLRGGRRECYHSATVAPFSISKQCHCASLCVSNLSVNIYLCQVSFNKFLCYEYKIVTCQNVQFAPIICSKLKLHK